MATLKEQVMAHLDAHGDMPYSQVENVIDVSASAFHKYRSEWREQHDTAKKTAITEPVRISAVMPSVHILQRVEAVKQFVAECGGLEAATEAMEVYAAART